MKTPDSPPNLAQWIAENLLPLDRAGTMDQTKGEAMLNELLHQREHPPSSDLAVVANMATRIAEAEKQYHRGTDLSNCAENMLERLLRVIRKAELCEWQQRDSYDFTTACGHVQRVEVERRVSDLGFTFCPYCGRTIKEL